MSQPIMGAETARALAVGPLRPHVDGFIAALSAGGYCRSSIRGVLAFVAQFSRWLSRRALAVSALDEARVREFLHGRRRRYHGHAGAAAAMAHLLRHLRATEAVKAQAGVTRRDGGRGVEQTFREYLRWERGLAEVTIEGYASLVRPFLVGRTGGRRRPRSRCRAADVTGFIVRQRARTSRGRMKLLVTALRSLLRFLHVSGRTATDLSACIPGVAHGQQTGLPKFIAAEGVRELIRRCDRRTECGRRDRVVLLLLARLGLRAGEIVHMTLDDIDWRAGELLVHGKGAREDRLPLPPDVGAALADYLQATRPACTSRRVFVTARAPRRGLAGSSVVSTIVRRAIERAGLRTPSKGAHLLRHSLASDLLRRGASLAEIGELLRHRSPDTTMLYAKVDVAALRELALPWPGGAA